MSKQVVLPLLVIALFLELSYGHQARSAGQSGAPAMDDRVAIAKVLAEQQSAWNKGDVSTFMKGYWNSPELTFAGSGGIARGWESVLARYKREYPDGAAMGQLNFSNVEVRFLGPDAALVLGQWHLDRSSGDIGGVFSLVFQRQPEGWRIVHDHTSVVKTTTQ